MQYSNWSDFEKFYQESTRFSHNTIATMGLGYGGASSEAKCAVFSLLYIKMVGTFHNKIIDYCSHNEIKTKNKPLRTLLGKLKEHNVINLNFTELECILCKRNNIAHEPDFLVSESKFKTDKKTLFAEYSKL